jgi:hypothetical protein
MMASKPGLVLWSGTNAARACRLAVWCPVWRWRDGVSGSFRERGNLLCTDAKGAEPVVSAMRASVPMRYTGAEQLVVTSKPGNAGGAKGLRH